MYQNKLFLWKWKYFYEAYEYIYYTSWKTREVLMLVIAWRKMEDTTEQEWE